MELDRRTFMKSTFALPLVPSLTKLEPSKAARLIVHARAQIGVTTSYDPAYVALDYPGGDIPRDRGVCIDVIIRAYRDAFGFDFQEHVHNDMSAHFGLYPQR